MINREDLLSGTRPEIHGRVLITVMEHFDGYQVMDYKGMVWGISMRVKDMGQDYIMGCKQVTGGELTSFTELFDETRQRAVDRMIDMAKRIGANAIINFEFSQNPSTTGSEVTAFGNAVIIKPIKNYVPIGGLGNLLAEFVDIFAEKSTGSAGQKNVESHLHTDDTHNVTASVAAHAPIEHKIDNPTQPQMIGKLAKEDSQLFVLCPSCGMKYAAEVTSNMVIKVRNFEDEDPDERGQQIFCIKCGQKFTVPQKH